MPIELTVGKPGNGKTLLTVAKVLKPMLDEKIEYEGRKIPRRLMVGGIPGLLLEHQLVDVPETQAAGYRDEWSGKEREPGDPPVDVPIRADNWWLWCMPGDVIVIDECQRLFRPAAAGKTLPWCISRLERHRHYGIDFVIITQHPQLLHANVRNLVGKQREVRRLGGRGAALVYEWDHCTNPDRIKTATTTLFRYPKEAFNWYKSAEVHTKQKFMVGTPFYMGVVAFLLLPFLFYWAYSRVASKEPDKLGEGASIGAAASQGSASSPHASTVSHAKPPQGKPASAWPVVDPRPIKDDAEPYEGRAFVLQGTYTLMGQVHGYFEVYQDGRRIGPVSLAALLRAGYVWVSAGDCTGRLIYKNGTERPVSCGHPAPAPEPQRRGPDDGARDLPSSMAPTA